jgi:deoxycytidine triphosphate deaminase
MVTHAKEYFLNMCSWSWEEPLQTLRPYCLITNEKFNMPDNITALCFNRSSITRLGAILGTAVVDAGFTGHLSFSAFTTQPIRFSKNIAIAQICFFKHKPTFEYHGQYKEIAKV